MKLFCCFAVAMLAALPVHGASPAQRTDAGCEVVVASQTSGRIHVFDAASLEPLGSIVVGDSNESVTVAVGGRTLYVTRAVRVGDATGCCGLFALDLKTATLTPIVEPVQRATPSADGRWIFAQRGNVGIDLFEASSLERLPTIKAPGVYGLYPSPDGRWLFGTTIWAGPSLDIVEIASMTLARRLALPPDLSPRGAWIGDRFYVYAYDGAKGLLWTAAAESSSLGAPVAVALPNLGNGGETVWQEVIAVGDMLALYEPFASKLDRRQSSTPPGAIPGGVFLVDPATGKLLRHVAPSVYFNSVEASADGRYLYGLDPNGSRWQGPVRLVKIDTASGRIVGERLLEKDRWSLSVGELEEALIPRGEVQLRKH